jgi:hypothetical protein
MTLPEGENQTYWLDGYNIKDRVSTLAKQAYESRYGKTGVQREVNKPDFTKKKNAGTRIHNILAEIMDALYNKKGSISDIRARASKGDYAVSGDNFTALVNLVQDHIKTIRKVQAGIGKGDAIVRVEQKMASPLRNVGGALDVLVIFTDKTMGRIDYKTAHSNRFNYSNGVLTDDLLGINKVGDYELSMNEYGKILKEDVGIKGDRLVRLSPIHVRLALKPESQRKDYDFYNTTISKIETTNSVYLKPIPISGEKTNYKGIDELLKKQWILLSKLSKQLTEKTLSKTDRDAITLRVKNIRKSIQNTIIDEDISDIINSVNLLSAKLNNRIQEPKLIDNKPNNKYLDNNELEELISELSLYKDIIENTHHYYNDLKTNNSELFENMKDRISKASSNVLGILALARVHREDRLFETMDKYIGTSYKDADGHPLPLEELGWFERNMNEFSDIAHPVFKTAWKLISKADFNKNRDLKNLDEELSKVEKPLISWANQNNISRQAAFDMIIDTETGNLVSKMSKSLLEKIESAFVNPDTEQAYKILTSIFEIQNLEKYKENYKARLGKFQETQIHNYEGGESNSQYQKELQKWISENDLLTSHKAWTNPFNRNYWLRIKESVREANLSERYKKIKSNKALSDYYDFHVKQYKILKQILNISDYKTLPPTFIANIRKTMVDSIAMDHLNFRAAGRELWESLQIREDDAFIGDIDETGQLRRTIPILFTNPFRNSDNEIDNTKKSYDLSKNLLLFAKMAYNYKYVHEIEPDILQMRAYMANPTSEREGTKITNRSGKGIAGKMSTWLTKKGLDTQTYELFEEFTDYYLYGIKFKEANITKGKIDVVKTILKAKQYYSKSTLGLAVIPALGAYIAGNVASIFEGSKNISYTLEQLKQSHIHRVTDFKKYSALSLFYEVYSEDPLTKIIENKSSNFISRIATSRNLMYPLRKSDEVMNDSFINAMALNWGIDIEGKLGVKNALVRLSDISRNTKGIPTIWELTSVDEKGKVTVKGLTDDNYIAFREAVKGTSHNIIGSLSQDDISKRDTSLIHSIMFQFRSWMPAVVRERTGDLIYDDKLQAARWGRFRAAFSEFGLTDKDFETGFQLRRYMSKIFLPNLAKFTLDLFTFGAGTKFGLTSTTYIDPSGKEHKLRSNLERAKRMHYMYLTEHPELINSLTFEKFLEIKEGQMRAFTNELRAILMFAMVISLLGAGGGDDGKEPPYMANWFSRFAYKNFTKAQSELTYMWNPGELTKLVSSPVPMFGLLTRGVKTVMNGFDESKDIMFGENSPSDKTPVPYYLIQWIYGGGQMARLIELYKQYEKSPYLQPISGQ